MRALAIKFLLALFWVTLGVSNLHGSPQAGDEVSRLIDQLCAPQYADRMAAWGELRSRGSSIREQLASRLPKADRELAARLRELMGLIDLRLPDSMPHEMLEILMSFPAQDEETQSETLASLVRMGQYRLILDVIGQTGNPEAFASSLSESVSITSVLWELIQKDDWSMVRELVEHPVCRQLYPQYQLAWWITHEECGERLDELKRLVDSDEARPDDVKALIALLRFQRKSSEALGFLDLLDGKAKYPELDRQLLAESEGWSKILATDPAFARPANELESNALSARLLAAKYAGDESIYAATLKEINQRVLAANETKSESDPFGTQIFQTLIPALLAAGEIETAIPPMRQSNRQSVAELLQYLNRYDEAEVALGISGSLDDRLKRIESRISTFRRNSSEYERTGGSAVLERLEQAWALSLATATLLENEGLGAQSEFILQTLSNLITEQTYEQDDRVATLLETAVQMRNTRLVDSILARHLNNESNVYRICESLFPAKSAEAMFWIYRMTDLEVDLRHQIRLTSQLLNESFLVNEVPLDFERWLNDNQDRLDVSSHANDERVGSQEYMLARTYYFHGLRDQSMRHLEAAALSEHPLAIAWKGEMAYESSEWAEAAKLNEKLAKLDSADLGQACFACMRAAIAREHLGDMEHARKNRFAAFVGFENAGLSGNLINTAKETGMGSMLNQFCRINLATLEFQYSRSSLRLFFLNTAAMTCPPGDSELALPFVRQLLFDVGRENSSVSGVFVADMSLRESLLSAMNLWRRGDLEKAQSELNKVMRLRPANATIAEEYLAELKSDPRRDQLIQESQTSFLTELARYPASALLLNNFAWGNACLQVDLELSARAAEQAVALRSHQPSYLDTLAEVEFQRGNIDRAIELTAQCLQLQPDRAHYRRQMKKFLDARN